MYGCACSCAAQACQKELCISFVKSRWLCDLVFPAVIWAFSVSHLIAECQCGKEELQRVNLHTEAQAVETSAEGLLKGKMTELGGVICEASLRLRHRLKLSFCPLVQTGKKIRWSWGSIPEFVFQARSSSERQWSFCHIHSGFSLMQTTGDNVCFVPLFIDVVNVHAVYKSHNLVRNSVIIFIHALTGIVRHFGKCAHSIFVS